MSYPFDSRIQGSIYSYIDLEYLNRRSIEVNNTPLNLNYTISLLKLEQSILRAYEGYTVVRLDIYPKGDKEPTPGEYRNLIKRFVNAKRNNKEFDIFLGYCWRLELGEGYDITSGKWHMHMIFFFETTKYKAVRKKQQSVENLLYTIMLNVYGNEGNIPFYFWRNFSYKGSPHVSLGQWDQRRRLIEWLCYLCKETSNMRDIRLSKEEGRLFACSGLVTGPWGTPIYTINEAIDMGLCDCLDHNEDEDFDLLTRGY